MPIHSDAYLDGLIADKEQDLSRKTRAIFNRFEIAIVANQSRYTLPDNVFDVIDVSWQGFSLDSMHISDFRGSNWYKPNDLSNRVARPLGFLLANYGYTQIQFHPVPAVSYPLTSGNLYTRTGFNNAIVISCYRIADISGDEFRLRQRLLRNCIKYPAMVRAYAREGKGQDMAASNFFQKKAAFVEGSFIKIYQKMPKALIADVGERGQVGRLPRPQLPTTGPWSF